MTTRSPRKITSARPCSVVICELEGTNPVRLDAGTASAEFQYCDEHLIWLKKSIEQQEGRIKLVDPSEG